MKKSLTLILALILALGLVGCSQEANKEVSNPPVSQVEEPTTDKEEDVVKTPETDVKEDVIEENVDVPFQVAIEVDQTALQVMEDSKAERGYKLVKSEIPGYYYVMVFAGEKPSTGYDIKIEKVEIVDGVLTVSAVETTPSPDAINAQMLTYPMHIVTVQNIDENIDMTAVVEEVVVQTLEGTYVGKIDNNSIEVKVGEEALAVRLNYLSADQLDTLNLETDELITFEVYVNAEDQIILKSIGRIE